MRKPATPRRASLKTPPARAGVPVFIAPQLCLAAARAPAGDGWIAEAKIDGWRIQLNTQGSSPSLRTRKGLDCTGRFPAIAKAARVLPPAIIDGELTALDDGRMPDFPGLQAAMAAGRTDRLLFFAFDLLFDGVEDLRPLPLVARKRRLKALMSKKHSGLDGSLRYLDHLTADPDAVLASARELNLEGIVFKRADAPYVSARSGAWLKCKLRITQQVIIGGWWGKTRLRSLLVGVRRDGQLVYAGRIGTGFNAYNTGPLLTQLRALTDAANPFGGPNRPRKAPDITWIRPELAAEVTLAGWTNDGLVRQAAFKRLVAGRP